MKTPQDRSTSDAWGEIWLSRLLNLWFASFAGLLFFLYMLFIGVDLDGKSVFHLIFR